MAEVENLFLVEELLKIVNSKISAKQDKTNIEKIKKYVIEDRFSKEVNKQILESTVAELKYQLSKVEIPKNDENNAKQKLANLQKEIDFDKIKSEQEKKYNAIIAGNDYRQVLSVFNRKEIVKSIGIYFEIQNNGYCDLIIRHLQNENSQDIINAIIPYLPNEISRE